MDRHGFNLLVGRLRLPMYRFALSITGQSADAEDVVQDVSEKLWKMRAELEHLRSIEAYAMNAVRNRCIDYRRQASFRGEWPDTDNIVSDESPERRLEEQDMAAYIKRLIERLPEQQRMIVRLRDIECYEMAEIAEIMEMNEGAVRTALSRARQKLKEWLTR